MHKNGNKLLCLMFFICFLLILEITMNNTNQNNTIRYLTALPNINNILRGKNYVKNNKNFRPRVIQDCS